MITDSTKLRNIGISAHIDSGKTTLTERILYYTKRIHAMHDVKGKDGVGARMDSMPLERERGITIQSAATHCRWGDQHINIIDTPGHVDFTIEVERAMRVLDGAVLVLCAVAGVQSQSLTVDRQMRRYGVPRLAFVNKCDRAGASPLRVRDQLRSKLKLNPVMLQLPLGLERGYEGVIDLITLRAVRFGGDYGAEVITGPIPTPLAEQAHAAREQLLDGISMFSDELTEAILEERLTETLIHDALRQATIKRQIVPVLLGSAYTNKGVQPLLDAVSRYLPSPAETESVAVDPDRDEPYPLSCDPDEPLVMLAFKLEDGRFGQLTYMRLYQGSIQKGLAISNVRTGKRQKVGRLVRMHADEMEDIQRAVAGDIVAVFGIDARSGDTFTDGRLRLTMTSMHVPDPVISLKVTPQDHRSQTNLSKALRRFTKEDPTFHVNADDETGEMVISGMGELHLEVYLERMKREYSAHVDVGPPSVAYRETITRPVEFSYTHKKQSGGAGQFGRVAGIIEPYAYAHDDGALGGKMSRIVPAMDYRFCDEIVGGAIPREYIAAVDKGFFTMLERGILIGAPVRGISVRLNDGAAHPVDSSDLAFKEAAKGAWRQAYVKAKPQILEPLMKVVVEGPTETQGAVVSVLMQRRGIIIGTTDSGGFTVIEAQMPLAEMFGFATVLRSASQGRAEFTMEFSSYAPVPEGLAARLIAEHQAGRAGK